MSKSGSDKKSAARARKGKWFADVTEHSDALDFKPGVFANKSSAEIVRQLKESAERSTRRKASPFQAAMSMLTFYINRAGRDLPRIRLRVLDRAKQQLRKAFGRKP